MSNSPAIRVTLACYYREGKGGSEIKITSPKQHILEEIIQQDSLDREGLDPRICFPHSTMYHL